MGWRAAGVRGSFGEVSRPAAEGGWQEVRAEYGAEWRDQGRESVMLSDWRDWVDVAERRVLPTQWLALNATKSKFARQSSC